MIRFSLSASSPKIKSRKEMRPKFIYFNDIRFRISGIWKKATKHTV